MYTEEVKKRFINPKNVGILENANGIGEVGNPKCGDIMKIYLIIENDVIKNAKFQTFGCAAAIAASDAAIDIIIGKTIEEALKITNEAVVDTLKGLPPVKIHCSVLAEKGIKVAIENYMKPFGTKNNKSDADDVSEIQDFEKQDLTQGDEGDGCDGCCDSCGLKETHNKETQNDTNIVEA